MNQKIDVGNVLRQTFEVYRDQFTLLIPAALILFLPVALLTGLVQSGGGVLAALAASAIGVIATYWFQGAVVEAVRDILDGRRDYDLGSLFRSVTPVLGALIVAGILAGIAIGIGFILLIVPGLFLLTIWAVIAPVIVVERTGAIDSFGRSRALVKGNGWQVFGVILSLLLITIVIGAVFQALFIAISDSFLGYFIGSLVERVLVAPLSAIAAAVLYFELKGTRGEAVDSYAGVGAGTAGAAAATGPAGPAAPVAPEDPTQTQPPTQAPGTGGPPPPPPTEGGQGVQPGTPPPPQEGAQGRPGEPPEPGEPGGGPPSSPERPQP
jgi:hypothetical protein